MNPTRVDVPLDELVRALPSATVRFAAGYPLDGGVDDALATEALDVAAGADVVVAVLGLPADEESEGFDRTHLDLPAVQTDLLGRLAGGGAPVVVVLCHGGAVRTHPWSERVAAVVDCWLAGQAAGSALADVLTGAVNPSGRLAETVPLRLADVPSTLNFPGEQGVVRYGEGVFVGYRGFDATERDVAFPFGHGLSYTTFGYDELEVVVGQTSPDGDDLVVTVMCRVTNTGDRAGREVVQLYVGDPIAEVARPPWELAGFAKVALEPGESHRVAFTLTARDLSYWSTVDRRWVLEPGEFRFAVGASSRDLRLRRTLGIHAAPLRRPLTGMSTLEEWLADPDGAETVRAAVGHLDDGRPGGILGDPELLRVVGNFPVSTLAAFPGLGIDPEVVERLNR